MKLAISTPSILFPAITLLMLAYTNRFLALSQLIRALHVDYNNEKSSKTLSQIKHLRTRLKLIRYMQSLGVSSILICTLSIFALLMDKGTTGVILFSISISLFVASVISSLIEILMSSNALNVLLSDIEDDQII